MTNSVSNFVSNEQAPQSQVATTGSNASGTAGDLATGASNLSTSYQTFLTLLTTQLQNQDPTTPMDPNAFTSELVEMTGVQQQLLTNQLLQQLTNNVSNSVNLIGKTVTADSTAANLTDGSAVWHYGLPSAAASAEVTVTNSTGQVVFNGPAPSLTSGDNTFTWNGKDSSGVQQPDGVYTLAVSAEDSTGASLKTLISVTGVATSVQTLNGSDLITIGNTAVPVSSITNVTDPASSGSSGTSDNTSGS
ncbi:MAG: flagellar hook capping FlgD N-terminal domain-containing protein [Caulobacteraceae bacterium]